MKTRVILLLTLLALFIAAGCSSSTGNVTTPENNLAAASDGSGRTIVGTGQMEFDPVSMTVTNIPVRLGLAHYNVTTMINPPQCPDCVQIDFKGWVDQNLWVNFKLRNHYLRDAYDVRLIVMTGSTDFDLANDDGWTKLWDYEGGGTINPFIAYAEQETNRKFAINEERVEEVYIDLSSAPQIPLITYAVDVSWPANCNEPYLIQNFQQDAVLLPQTGVFTNVTVDVYDWQNDVNKVTIAAPEITGYAFTQMYHIDGHTWGAALYNNAAAGAGVYPLRIIATSSNSPSLALYDYFDLIVGN